MKMRRVHFVVLALAVTIVVARFFVAHHREEGSESRAARFEAQEVAGAGAVSAQPDEQDIARLDEFVPLPRSLACPPLVRMQ